MAEVFGSTPCHTSAWDGDKGPQDAWFADAVADDASRDFRLTARETSVLALIARGYTNSQIAESLGGFPKNTVKNHVRAILDTLGATWRRPRLSRTQAGHS